MVYRGRAAGLGKGLFFLPVVVVAVVVLLLLVLFFFRWCFRERGSAPDVIDVGSFA